jgi:hypothetical protein
MWTGLKREEVEEKKENYIVSSFITYTLHHSARVA